MRRKTLTIQMGIMLLGALTGLLLSPKAVLAATVRHVSTTGNDVGDCTIDPCRTIGYAISQSVSGDTIDIAAGTYLPVHVVVDRSLSFKGAGPGSTIIDGSAGGTVMMIGASSSSLDVKIAGVTVEHGLAQIGGGIASVPGAGHANTIAVTTSRIVSNRAVGAPGVGGGIYNGVGSTMRISLTTVSRNNAVGRQGGGSGQGAGIYNLGSLNFTDSTVSGNTAQGGGGACSQIGGSGQGGGIYGLGTVLVMRSTLSGNQATGGRGGSACINHGNGAPGGPGLGGGLDDAGAGSITLVNTTMSANGANGGPGGGCSTACQGGNGGDGRGGSLESNGQETMLNSTIAGNLTAPGKPGCNAFGGSCGHVGITSGGGLDIGGSVKLTNTILAHNSAGTGPDCDGVVTSGGHNLLGYDSSCAGFNGPGDLVNVDPLLGKLKKNGGPTKTMALVHGSPAIDAADDAVCAAKPVNGIDQRGVSRPQGLHCDIGAYEKE